VSFLQTLLNFLLLFFTSNFDEFASSRYLLASHWLGSSGFQANRSSGKGVEGYQYFVGWSTAPQRRCSSTGSRSTYWWSGRWLSKIVDNHVFRYASSQSSIGKFLSSCLMLLDLVNEFIIW
jgi:hypothetical protein